MMRSKVVLPQPEGPRKTSISPCRTCRSMFPNALKLPKSLRIPRSSRDGRRSVMSIPSLWVDQSQGRRVPQCPRARERALLGLGLTLGVVTPAPLRQYLVAVLRGKGKVVLDQHLFVVGRQTLQRLVDRGMGDDGNVLLIHLVGFLAGRPVGQLLGSIEFFGVFHDAGGLDVPTQPFLGKHQVNRRTATLDLGAAIFE